MYADVSPSSSRCLLFACLLVTSFFVAGCGSESTSTTSNDRDSISADSIIQKAIAAHGGSVLDTSVVTFNFRGAQFRLIHDNGRFRYERRATDSLGQQVLEVLSNDSLYRAVNSEIVDLSAEEQASMNTTVNSVSYFALLPYKLSDSAVHARRLGVDTVRSTPYYRVEVTFAPEGGGQDWEDRFVYWFDTENYHMDYLAYAYGLGGNEEPGHRFRAAYNLREIENVRIADYKNYTDTTITPSTIENYPRRLDAPTLEEVSHVELDSVRVKSLRD